MGLAGAGFGASLGLEDILARQIEKQKLQQAIQQERDRMALEQSRLNMEQQDRVTARNIAQQGVDLRNREFDAEQAASKTDRNVGLDAANVLNMPGMTDAQKATELQQSVLRNPTAKSAPGMLKVIEGLTKAPAKPGTHVVGGNLVDETGKVLYAAPEKPTKPEKPGVHVVGGNLVDDSGKVLFTDPNKTKDGGPSSYASERAFRTVQSVDELMGQANGWNTGYGSLLSSIPQTEARHFRSQLDTLKANIAFNELTQMREASKTGGALGQVSDREGALLQSALGALDQAQTAGQLKEQLQKIKASVQRWEQAQQMGNMSAAPSHNTTAGAASPYQEYLRRKGGGR